MNIGGAERVVLNYARLLPQQGHDVLVVSSGGALLDEMMSAGAEHVEADFLFQRDPDSFMRSIRFLRATLRDWQPDIVHVHTFVALVEVWLATSLDGRPRPKLVYMTHGPEHDSVWPLIRIFGTRAADKIITVSPYHHDLLLAQGLASEQLTYIPNGLAANFEGGGECAGKKVRRELGIPADAFLVGTVCRLVEGKGVHFLIESLARLDCHIYGLIVGDGPEFARLQKLARDLGVADRVCFTGYRRDVDRLLSALEVFCSVSHAEAFPVVLLEAMRAGVPIVCFDWDGAREILGDDATIVPQGDVLSLGRAMEKLATNPVLREEAGKRGHDRFLKRYTLDCNLSKLERVYREVKAQA